MKKIFTLPYAYVVLWCLYYMQGLLFEENSNASQIILVILLVFSGYYYYKLFSKKKDIKIQYIRTVNVLFLFFLLYGVIYFMSGKNYVISRSGTVVQSFGFVKQILISYFPLFTVYYFCKRKLISKDDLKIWIILFLVTSIVLFYVERINAIRMAIEMNLTRSEFVNNSAYFFVAIIPILILWEKKPTIQYALFFVCIAFILLTMKRGAIVCGGIASLLFINHTVLSKRKKNKVGIIGLTMILIFLIYYFVSDLLVNSNLFSERINETLAGNTSGRDVIYTDLIRHIFDRDNPLYLLVGEGANATLLYAENYAHNDWLEIAICEGFIGVIIYALYWKVFYKTMIFFKGGNMNYFVIKSYFIILFVSSFFSMSFNAVPIFTSISLGAFMAFAEHEKKVEYLN